MKREKNPRLTWGVNSRDAARTPAGFSVVELVLSIVIGALLILALTQIIGNYIALSQKSRNVVLANSYVEGKMETLRNIGFNGLNNGTSNITSELPSQLPSPKSASLVVSAHADNLKQVDISLTYNDKGKTQTYNYTAYVGEISVLQ